MMSSVMGSAVREVELSALDVGLENENVCTDRTDFVPALEPGAGDGGA